MPLLRILPGLVLLASPLTAATVQFAQTAVNDADGSPLGAVSSLAFVESGTTVDTVTAPAVSGSYRFTHWTTGGAAVYRDAWGRSLNPASVLLEQNTTATAHYLAASRDSDTDSIPDWVEMEYFGDLTRTAADDGDGDGLTLAAEVSGGTHPLYANATQEGGVAFSDSAMVTVNLAGYPAYTLRSQPAGTVDQSGIAPPGTVITTPSLSANAAFGYWAVDGSREADAWGVAWPQVSFTMASTDRAAVAHLFPGDTDSDGVPDAWEQYYYGTLTHTAASDTDGDGRTLLAEYTGGSSPVFGNAFQEGGVAWIDSSLLEVNLAGYATYTLRSQPAGTVDQSAAVAPGTVITTPDLSANAAFGYWLVDGVREADDWGVARPQASFTMASADREAVVYLFPGDTDSDGVPDAWEQYYYGTLTHNAASDTDGDGRTLLAEYTGGSSPVFGNAFQEGGVSWMDSTLVIFDSNDPPVAMPATYTRGPKAQLKISIAALLAAAASDPDAQALTVTAGASVQGAQVTVSGGWILYRPANELDDSFTYTVTDPFGASSQSTITVNVVTPAGKTGNLTLNGLGQPEVKFTGIPGFRYRIERSPDLVSWSTMETVTAPANGLFTFTDTNPPGGSAYYRMRYDPQ